MDEWIKEEAAKRRKLKQQFPKLFNDVSAILFKHDPMHINYDDNTNEYEPEAGTIIPRLTSCSDPMDVRKVIYEEFVRWFYDDVGDESVYTNIAKEIWEVWTDHRTDA